MAKQTLFSMLVRQPWWLSLIVAAVLFTALNLVVPAILALAVAVPFMFVALYALWRQLRSPGAAALARAAVAMRAMSWPEFSAALRARYGRAGYTVGDVKHEGADFELARKGKISLVACRRWKAAHAGIGPLRDLRAAMHERNVHRGIFICSGAISSDARAYAAQNSITLIDAAALAEMLAKA